MEKVLKNAEKLLHKVEWITVACYVMGFILGKVMIHIFNTRGHIHNGAGRFLVEVFIIACCIMLIESARFGINKLVRRS